MSFADRRSVFDMLSFRDALAIMGASAKRFKKMTMPEEYNYSAVRFTESLKASFIGTGTESDERYSPRILGNEDKRAANVLSRF